MTPTTPTLIKKLARCLTKVTTFILCVLLIEVIEVINKFLISRINSNNFSGNTSEPNRIKAYLEFLQLLKLSYTNT